MKSYQVPAYQKSRQSQITIIIPAHGIFCNRKAPPQGTQQEEGAVAGEFPPAPKLPKKKI
ncbi:MAG: hypothetical protein CEE38_08580 [Planctomycetes bacterium B3_Pla]|nr:MAG: hypothetical protein CEE38_08580 [Planctomycetes bacterium B3_Pla]